MSAEKRSCWLCKHVSFVPQEGPYSEVTPGTPALFRCLRDHWDMVKWDREDDMRKSLAQAENCVDFADYKAVEGTKAPDKLYWHCSKCGAHEEVEKTVPAYVHGDKEPCITCANGTAQVMTTEEAAAIEQAWALSADAEQREARRAASEKEGK